MRRLWIQGCANAVIEEQTEVNQGFIVSILKAMLDLLPSRSHCTTC